MEKFLGLTILSFFVSAILIVPFIDFLYRMKMRRQHQVTKDMFNKRTPIFDKLNAWKAGTPIGGGLLIIVVTAIFTLWAYGIFGLKLKPWEIFVLFFSFLSFGALGFYDDLKKIVGVGTGQNKFFGLRFRHKFIIQWVLALIIATVFYFQLSYNFVFIHGLGIVNIGILFIPFAALVIVSFANAINITDGLDGLATGLLLICLIAFLTINFAQLDEPLGIFIAILMGSIAAFLYFNIYRARLWLGDVGSLALGAVLAVIGLLTGKVLALMIIGGVFVLEAGSSLIQLLSKKYLGRKAFTVAPLHLYLQNRGWEEPKIVMRAWLLGFLLAVLGIFIAFI